MRLILNIKSFFQIFCYRIKKNILNSNNLKSNNNVDFHDNEKNNI